MSVYFSNLGNYGKMGNALFQAACTMALARRNGVSYVFPNSWKYKNDFSISPECFVPQIRTSVSYQEPHFHYTPIAYRPNMNLLGYFQSEKYFIDCADYIRLALKPKQRRALQKGVVGIHVRRGDYVTLPNHHPALTMDYYEKAMSILNADKFLVCSDDIPWCKQHFIGNQFEFSESNNEIIDFCLQQSCENNIIANSSYSWWAAWLNENKDKTIIAPKKWFGTLITHSTQDLYPDDWIVI